jgi:hypothetical protein
LDVAAKMFILLPEKSAWATDIVTLVCYLINECGATRGGDSVPWIAKCKHQRIDAIESRHAAALTLIWCLKKVRMHHDLVHRLAREVLRTDWKEWME